MRSRRKPSAKKQAGIVAWKLSDAERDLLWHIENGYQLETDSLGSDLVLRRSKDDELLRPAAANRNTLKALEERGLIVPGKSRDPFKIVWRLRRKAKE
jgi:hypothetical protein